MCKTLGTTSAEAPSPLAPPVPSRRCGAAAKPRRGDGSKQTNWYYKSQKYPTEAGSAEELRQPDDLVPPQ